jgi:hypothetical protein
MDIHLEDSVSTKSVWHELHKSNIRGKAAIAKPLITICNDQMCKHWMSHHNHKTWTSGNWKSACGKVRWVILHAVPYFRKSLHLENTLGSLRSGMFGSNSETWERFCDGLGNIVVQYSVGPTITLHGQGNTWAGLGNHVHPMNQTFLDAIYHIIFFNCNLQSTLVFFGVISKFARIRCLE